MLVKLLIDNYKQKESMMLSAYTRPAYAQLLLLLISVVLGSIAIWLFIQQPWLGVTLDVIDDEIRIIHVSDDRAAQIAIGAKLQKVVSPSGKAFTLIPTDLSMESDFCDSYRELDEFFARQTILANLLKEHDATLIWIDKRGKEGKSTITLKKRTLQDLPVVFLLQIFVATAGFLLSTWIFLLRPTDLGARLFMLAGLMYPITVFTNAISGNRELAISGDLFRTLASINHISGTLCACALIALFVSYPCKLVRTRTLFLLPIFFGAWAIADGMEWVPDQVWGSRIPSMLQMLFIILLSVVQWQKTQGQPLERAALRWFILAGVVGSILFIIYVFRFNLPSFIAIPPRGILIVEFLLMWIGIAMGLRRYHLYDMDEWSYRGLLWVAGAVAIFIFDAALAYMGATQVASLSMSLLISGWLYFPFRQWLWQKIVRRPATNYENLLPELSIIAFTVSVSEQQMRWEALLRKLFDPLEIKIATSNKNGGQLLEEGLALQVPACEKLPCFLMRYAGRGSRLFSSRDAELVTSLSDLLANVMSGRSSYEQGVEEERMRIGRDLHDNIGARLLKLIHQLRGTPSVEVARDAMKDLRTSIAALDAQPVPLLNALADWRAEADGRCEAAACKLNWSQSAQLPAQELIPRNKASLESVMREVITNALKHAAAKHIKVNIEAIDNSLYIIIENDGQIAEFSTWKDGYGLRNLRGRLTELGGSLKISAENRSVQMQIRVPLL
jgi:signal transduction histidine kinase